MYVKVNEIIKKGNRIEIAYEQEGLDHYFATKDNLFWEYDMDVSEVPDSIAVIPFVCDIIPMAFVLDFQIKVDELDQDFYECIANYREGYKKLITCLKFRGAVIADKLVKNDYKTDKDCVMFSGGIDATCTLAQNDATVSDCITVWGADVNSNNEEGWRVLSKSIEDTVKKFDKNWYVIKSNFREALREDVLKQCIKATGDGWWHACQHGIALLGCTAPMAYLMGYKTIHIASSFTAKFRAICASDPYTDNCFRVGNTKAHHDGFELDRCQKTKVISDAIDAKKITLNLHVCWESSSGENCGKCEKCIRSYLNCLVVGVDPAKLGMVCSVPMSEVKRKYWLDYDYEKDNVYARFMLIKESLQTTYGKNPPKNLKWIMRMNPRFVMVTPYWQAKKIYRKLKKIYKKVG